MLFKNNEDDLKIEDMDERGNKTDNLQGALRRSF